jgi:hypothetical protein
MKHFARIRRRGLPLLLCLCSTGALAAAKAPPKPVPPKTLCLEIGDSLFSPEMRKIAETNIHVEEPFGEITRRLAGYAGVTVSDVTSGCEPILRVAGSFG